MWQVAFSSKRVLRKTSAALADERVAVDERDLAEHRGALVAVDLLPDQLRAGARLHVHDAAGLEAKLEVPYDGAGKCQRHRRAYRPFGPAAVGAGEDLLRRHVRDEAAFVHRLADAADPVEPGMRPTLRSVPGPRKRIRSKPRSSARRLDARACRGARSRPRPGRPRPGASPWRSPARAARRRARRTRLAPSPRFG